MNERSSTKRVNGRAERSPCERVDLKLPVVASSEARRPSGSGFKSRRLARVDRVRGSERTGRVPASRTSGPSARLGTNGASPLPSGRFAPSSQWTTERRSFRPRFIFPRDIIV